MQGVGIADNAPTYNGVLLDEGWLKARGMCLMHYYADRVLADVGEVVGFCLEGLACCYGPEADRLSRLLSDLGSGEVYLYDTWEGCRLPQVEYGPVVDFRDFC